MNLPNQTQKRIKNKNSSKMIHSFADKLEWKKVHQIMNDTSDIQHNSIMSTRKEFITAMEKLAKHAIVNILDLKEYSKEDIYRLAVSEDFNEMIYEVLSEKNKE